MDWQQVDELFDVAADLPEGEQAAFLAQACGDQPELHKQVERLLAADRGAKHFLDRPVARMTASPLPPTDQRGSDPIRVGPYRILRPLAEGGMGSVFIASRDDDEYERLVAVKLVRRGLDSSHARQRFRRERQILAGLEHPHIARLYEGGTTEAGQPFLVMELVEGLPVDTHCDHHRLSIDQRLALFIQVCGAVTFAHRNLVIHRDLKPGNILVTEGGVPKLLDFGIAKLLDNEHHIADATATGFSPRTPAYSSPEQVRAEAVTTASDVYALGCLLYKLVCGHRPYRLESNLPLELETAILSQESQPPSAVLLRSGAGGQGPSADEIASARGTDAKSLDRRLRGDLDLIVLKALKKTPAERYGSSQELAQDLRHFLADLPVTAQADSPTYRARKFLRRHRPAVVVGLVFLGMILAFTGLLASQVAKTARQRDLAEQVTAFVTGLFDEARPRSGSGTEVSARQLVDAGASKIQRDLAGAPEVRAALQHTIGSIYNQLAAHEEAEELLQPALAAREELGDPAAVAKTLIELGVAARERAKHERAEVYLRRALKLCEGASEVDCPQASTYTHLGSLLRERGKYQQARATFEQGLGRLHGLEPDLRHAAIHGNLGRIHLELQDFDGALESFQQSLDVRERILGSDHPALAIDLNNVAIIHSSRGQYPLAAQMWHRAIRLQEQATGRTHPLVANSLNNLAILHEMQGDYEQAQEHYSDALEVRREIFGPDHPRLISTLHNFGGLLLWRGEIAAARQPLLDATRIVENSLSEHRLTGENSAWLAELARYTGDFATAQRLSRQALEVFDQTEGQELLEVAGQWARLAWVAYAEGDFVASEESYRKAIDTIDNTPLTEENWRAQYLNGLAMALFRLDKLEAAEATWQQALAVAIRAYAEDASPSNKNQQAVAELGLAKIYGRGEQADLQQAALERALEIAADVAARSDLLRHLDTHAKALLMLKQAEAARPIVAHLRDRGWNDPDFLELSRGL